MSKTLIPYITTAGLQAALRAHEDERQIAVCITEIGLGNKGYTPEVENGHALATRLQDEQQRVKIVNGRAISPYQLELSTIVEGESEYAIRELGFYLQDGTLFGIWSDPQRALAWKSRDVPLVITLELGLASLPRDSVTLEVNDDEKMALLMAKELATASTAIVHLQLGQLRQEDQIKAQIDALEQQDQACLGLQEQLARYIETQRQRLALLDATLQRLQSQKLNVDAKAVDSAKLNGTVESMSATIDTLAKRDNSGDLFARLFRSTYAEQGVAPSSDADIAFRNNDSSDNGIRFMNKDAMRSWLGLGLMLHFVAEPKNIRLASAKHQIVKDIQPVGVPGSVKALLVNISTGGTTDHVVHSFGRYAGHHHHTWSNEVYLKNTYLNDVMISHYHSIGFSYGNHILPLKSNGRFDAQLCMGYSGGWHHITLQVIGYFI